MNELIWFSIPGAIVLITLKLILPEKAWEGMDSTLIVATAPVIGFGMHQLFRTIFEYFGGWESDRREVFVLIRKEFGINSSDRHTPFLVWETTFYSDKIPETFQSHGRGTWHYLMSFGSIVMTLLFATCFLVLSQVFWISQTPQFFQYNRVWMILGFVFVLSIFLLKLYLTFKSLMRQECSVFLKYQDEFKKTMEKISS